MPRFAGLAGPCYRPGHAAVPPSPSSCVLKRLMRHPAAVGLGTWTLAAYLRFALRSTRWTLHGADRLGPYLEANPAIFAFWHECLPLMPALWTLALRHRAGAGLPRGRMVVLVSRHQDGRLIGRMMRGFGLDVAHGSSAKRGEQKGGAAGLRALLDVLATGSQVVITPDGPRGPRHQAAPGVAQLAALAGVPVIPCAARLTRRRVLPTWDSMILPLPWGRGALVCGTPIPVGRGAWRDALVPIAAAMTEAAEMAEALCAA